MLFQTLIIAFASSSLVQAYGNGYDNGYGSGYGKNYVSSSQNTLSRKPCSNYEYGKGECFTPKPAVDPVPVVDPKPVIDPKNPVAFACKTGGCFIKNGKEQCDNTQQCEYDDNKY